jgi:hypothetical protein
VVFVVLIYWAAVGVDVMADDKSKRGTPDRARVSAAEPYEVSYLARKFDLPPPLVRNVIQQEGPMRTAVERYLRQMKRNAR